jgi:preprotein translocase subunit SecF
MYNIIQKRKIFLSLSSFLVILSLIALFVWGLNFGIDFTGGSLLEVEFKGDRPSIEDVQVALNDFDLGSLVLQPVNEKGLILRFQDTSEQKHREVLEKLSLMDTGLVLENEENNNKEDDLALELENIDGIEIEYASSSEGELASSTVKLAELEDDTALIEELRYDSVGPSIGEELKRKSVTAIFVVIVAIVLYIAWAFKKVSRPVESWKYGVSAIIALFHDVIITLGAFAILGYIYDIEINTAFVAAILTVLGYSVNDTIVVFDRVRENLPKSDDDFETTVNTSVNQTITRSINTSVTTLVVLLSILFFGGSTIRDFVLALSIGVAIGTYSSIFLASPVLVVWEKMKK